MHQWDTVMYHSTVCIKRESRWKDLLQSWSSNSRREAISRRSSNRPITRNSVKTRSQKGSTGTVTSQMWIATKLIQAILEGSRSHEKYLSALSIIWAADFLRKSNESVIKYRQPLLKATSTRAQFKSYLNFKSQSTWRSLSVTWSSRRSCTQQPVQMSKCPF